MMSDPEEKERHAKRRKRNLIAKELRTNRLFRPRIKKPKEYETFDKKKILNGEYDND